MRLSRDFILFSPTDKPERIEMFYCPIIENRRVVWFGCKNEINHLEHHGKMHLASCLIAALMGIITITTATSGGSRNFKIGGRGLEFVLKPLHIYPMFL